MGKGLITGLAIVGGGLFFLDLYEKEYSDADLPPGIGIQLVNPPINADNWTWSYTQEATDGTTGINSDLTAINDISWIEPGFMPVTIWDIWVTLSDGGQWVVQGYDVNDPNLPYQNIMIEAEGLYEYDCVNGGMTKVG